MQIYMAQASDFDRILSFYHRLIDEMWGSPYLPGWEKEKHPSNDLIATSIEQEEMFICENDGVIVGAMILNHEVGQGYDEAKWLIDAPENEVTVLHVIAVSPDMQGKGVADELMQYAIAYVKRLGQKSLRLDVMKGNTPAEKLYDRFGFVCVHERRSLYGNAGWITARLLELVL